MSWVSDPPKRCPTCGNELVLAIVDRNATGDVFARLCLACTEAADVRAAYEAQPWETRL